MCAYHHNKCAVIYVQVEIKKLYMQLERYMLQRATYDFNNGQCGDSPLDYFLMCI